MKLKKIEKSNSGKRGQEWSVGKIMTLVLVVVIVVLIIYGVSNNLMGPITNKVAGYYNYVLNYFNPAPVVPVSDVIFVNILGKQRNLTLNDGENRCIVNIEELGKFALDFKDGSNFVWNINFERRWEGASSQWPLVSSLLKDITFYPTDWRFVYLVKDEAVIQEMNKLSSDLKINIDGKIYPVVFNSDGLIANISGKYYIYYSPFEGASPYLGIYDLDTKIISQSSDLVEELRKIKYSFNNLMESLKVNIYGAERNVSLVKVKADSYGNERADYSFFAVDAGYFSIYAGFNKNMLDQSYTRTYIEFKSKEKLEKSLDEIKTALDKNCR